MSKSFILGSVACVVAAMLAGCATGGKGASDEELIRSVLDVWAAGQAEQDADKVMTCYSEDFSNYEIPDKDAVRDFIEQAIDMGYYEGVEVLFDDAEIEIDGATATVYPIDWSSDAGEVTIETVLTKEAGDWLITDMEIEGL